MNDKIIYRGPDREGIFADDVCALGMRRLSIIDIDGGNQPMWNDDKKVLSFIQGLIQR